MASNRRIGARSSGRPDDDSDSDSTGAVGPSQSFGRASSGKRRRRGKTMRRQRTAVPELHQSKEEFVAEWGITPEEEETRVRALHARLRKEGHIKPDMPPYYHDYYTIRRFVRARQHDLERAHVMLLDHFRWRKEVGADDILRSFYFQERDSLLTIYPQGYHKTDKMGRPLYIQKMGTIDLKKILEVTSEERMLKFRIQEWERCLRYIMPVCSKVAGCKIEQTFAILDVSGVGLKHLTGEVKRLMAKVTRMDQDNYPEMLGHTCIINAPAVFKMIWAVCKPMLDLRTQNKIEVCPRDYTPALLNWIDADSLPTYLGGRSTATLLDDAGPWHQPELVEEVEAEYKRAAGALYSDDDASTTHSDAEDTATKPLPPPLRIAAPAHSASGAESEFESDDGFQSPRSEFSVASFSSAVTSVGARGGGAGVGPSSGIALRSPNGSSHAIGHADRDAVEGLGTAGMEGHQAWPQEQGPGAQPSSLIARVHALESAISGRLAAVKAQGHVVPPPSLHVEMGGSLSDRVAALEYAMEALLRAEEVELAEREPPKGRQGACSSCCVMQ